MATNTLLLTMIMYCENCLQGNLIDGALEEVILILNKQRQWEAFDTKYLFFKVRGHFRDFKQDLLHLYHHPIKRTRETCILHNVHLYY